MATPYKLAHKLLMDSIGAPDDYHAGWKAISRDLTRLVFHSGFHPSGSAVPGLIRAKLKAGISEAAVLREAANAPLSESDASALAGKRRALALKTLRHLYYHDSFGQQKIWILSLPAALDSYPLEYAGNDQGVVDQVLNSCDEMFAPATMMDLSDAAQLALSWVHKAMMVTSAPSRPYNINLIRRWFIPEGARDEANKVGTVVGTLQLHLQRIAAALKTGSIILTDSPHERETDSKLERSEAFVYTQDDLLVIHVEKGFFGGRNTLSGRANWARILVHELSHLFAKTEDYSYSWQGLLPRDSDMLKSGNDAAVVRFRGFQAVRTLTFDQCINNADSWAFFVADCAGALVERDRVQALGNRLYEIGNVPMEPPLAANVQARAAMK